LLCYRLLCKAWPVAGCDTAAHTRHGARRDGCSSFSRARARVLAHAGLKSSAQGQARPRRQGAGPGHPWPAPRVPLTQLEATASQGGRARWTPRSSQTAVSTSDARMQPLEGTSNTSLCDGRPFPESGLPHFIQIRTLQCPTNGTDQKKRVISGNGANTNGHGSTIPHWTTKSPASASEKPGSPCFSARQAY
jgi:hypothetical protein